MKNVTLSADEKLIALAREKAREEHTTLNDQFRRWLEEYVGRDDRAERAMATIRDLQERIRLQGPFPREALDER